MIVAAVLQLALRTKANSLGYRILAVGVPLMATALLAVRTATITATTFESIYEIARVHPIAYLTPIGYVVAALLAALLPVDSRAFSLLPLAMGYACFWFSFTYYANPSIEVPHPPATFLWAAVGQGVLPLLASLGVLMPVYARRQRARRTRP